MTPTRLLALGRTYARAELASRAACVEYRRLRRAGDEAESIERDRVRLIDERARALREYLQATVEELGAAVARGDAGDG